MLIRGSGKVTSNIIPRKIAEHEYFAQKQLLEKKKLHINSCLNVQ